MLVGQMLHGYCGGLFDYDNYGDKRVEAVGFDWVVARDDAGRPAFACTHDGSPIAPRLAPFCQKPDEAV